MAENSKISWTDHTFNPWVGCTKVSPGCKHCYAEALMDHRWGKVQWGPTGTRVRTSAANWREPLRWNRRAEKEGRRYKVFCASLADVFEDRKELWPWRQDLFSMIGNTPYLDWLLLTKRPENISDMVAEVTGGYLNIADFENIWIGTSVENQEQADKRIPHLLNVPAKVRFLSCEPLLSSVDLDLAHWQGTLWHGGGIQWVIAGAESGHGARPMDTDWVRDLRDQCQAAAVPFFFKQMIAEGKKVELPALDGAVWAQFPKG